MTLVGSILKCGPHPDLYTYRCSEYGEVETKEG